MRASLLRRGAPRLCLAALAAACLARPAEGLRSGRAAAGQPVEDQHFLGSTYGFLRDTSDGVGKAAQTVLAVQGSLDEMRKDLATEYSKWSEKKKALVAESERLKSGIARLQAEKTEQGTLREKKLRLDGEVATKKEMNRQANEAQKKASEAIAKERGQLQAHITALEGMVAEVESSKGRSKAFFENATNHARQHNRELQGKVLALNQQLLDVQAQQNSHRVEAEKNRTNLLTQIDAAQAQLDLAQSEALERAKLEQELENYKKRVAAQIEQLNIQKKAMESLKAGCVAAVKGMENEIGVAKHSISQSNLAMRDCQDIDADNQRLQDTLNQCTAAKRSVR